jgi:predicted amidophosphoribosyltransferase
MDPSAWPTPFGVISGASALTRTALASLGRIGTDIASIAAPDSCAGCQRPGLSLCSGCEDLLVGVPHPHVPSPRPSTWLDLHVVTAYAGTTRSIIAAWKERGRRDLAPYLARALTGSIAAALSARRPGEAQMPGEVQAAVVPIPSTRAARRRRGEDAWGRVVSMAVEQLRADGARVHLDPVLAHVRQPRDQSALDARERRRNLDGALTCSRAPSWPVIVVDDIVTTGSTLAAAARALGVAGVTDACAAAIASTSRDRARCRPAD